MKARPALARRRARGERPFALSAGPVVALLFFASGASLASAPRSFGPFGSEKSPVTRDAAFRRAAPAAPEPPDTFLRLSYEFYRTVVTPIDGPRCAHRPTCSRYGLLAVRAHGAIGLLLTVDRLLRGGDSSAVRRLRLLREGDRLYLSDPVEESTFWLSRP